MRFKVRLGQSRCENYNVNLFYTYDGISPTAAPLLCE